VINAADEVLVKRFLVGEIPFTGIASGLRVILDRWRVASPDLNEDRITLKSILDADRWAREEARNLSLSDL
jgi:1-deoxy-D-xylulose 5-phosphate reductoisomerase